MLKKRKVRYFGGEAIINHSSNTFKIQGSPTVIQIIDRHGKNLAKFVIKQVEKEIITLLGKGGKPTQYKNLRTIHVEIPKGKNCTIDVIPDMKQIHTNPKIQFHPLTKNKMEGKRIDIIIHDR